MPSIMLSPLMKWTLAAAGGAMVVHWAVREVRRINEEIDQAKAACALPTPSAARSSDAIRRPANFGSSEFRKRGTTGRAQWPDESGPPLIMAPKNKASSANPTS